MSDPATGGSAGWVDEVLDFWFGLGQEQWFSSDPALDEQVRKRFARLHEEQRQFPAEHFLADARTALAGVVLFDQLPRNMHRGEAEQYATDPLALRIAWQAVQRGLDETLTVPERSVLYLPFQHSEDGDDQRQSLLLYTGLGDDKALEFAHKHHAIIAKFGRFPHRNAILGRQPRAAEIAAGDVTPF